MKPSVNHNKGKTQISFAAAGQHGLIDFYGASFLTNQNYIEQALISAAKKCGATIIGQNFHKFGGEGGVTGVLLLAESHISIHTWPETDYAAIDIFMCGVSPHIKISIAA